MNLKKLSRRQLIRYAVLAGFALIGLLFIGRLYLVLTLPSVETLRELQLSVPLRVLTSDGQLIEEFGAERRALIKFADIPEPVAQAFIAAEDSNFYEHGGVDYWGLVRASLKLIATGEKAQGGSTITMQLARNVFLSSEKTFTRKFREILLAQKIEKELSKDEILELYLNKIYLGERAYGIAAAARIYFDKDLKNISLSEAAVLASLPKAPSANNPVKNPARAIERRNYVLRRMHELDFITKEQFDKGIADPLRTRPAHLAGDIEAHYVAEMVRAELYAKFGEEAYARGYTVVTTIIASRQEAANTALRRSLMDYDERHGYRGAEAQIAPELLTQLAPGDTDVLEALDERPIIAGMTAAVVTAFAPDKISALTDSGAVEIAQADFKWANLSSKRPLKRGDFIRIKRANDRWKLSQVPEVQGAFVALNPKDGAIQALVGGFDFFEGKFNRVTQAKRQVGSGFKPYLYSAALAYGFTPASVILDAPVVFDDPKLESSWRPENYGGDFNGPMRMREALVQSRNMVSIRLLMAMGIPYARDYIPRFGMAADRIPQDLTMALGTAVYTPLEQARGYATIANGGFLIEPYFIKEVRDASGTVISQASPKIACLECEPAIPDNAGEAPASAVAPIPPSDIPASSLAPRVIQPQIIWMVTDMMRDVVRRGTAAAVAQLGRFDLAGKTGTTNDETDAWFNGFQKNIVAISWVGFDQPAPLGRGEVGGRAALPIWMDFMKSALRGVPQETLPRPRGLVNIRINPTSGRLAGPGDTNAIFETVPAERVPDLENGQDSPQKNGVEELY